MVILITFLARLLQPLQALAGLLGGAARARMELLIYVIDTLREVERLLDLSRAGFLPPDPAAPVPDLTTTDTPRQRVPRARRTPTRAVPYLRASRHLVPASCAPAVPRNSARRHDAHPGRCWLPAYLDISARGFPKAGPESIVKKWGLKRFAPARLNYFSFVTM